MNKKIWIIILIISSSFGFAQTENKKLNSQLEEMKNIMLNGNYEKLADYTYPRVIEIMGGKSNMIKVIKQSMNKIKNDGFSIINLKYINSSEFLRKGDELQCSLTQIIVMKTPKGKIESEYTLIAIFKDNGQNWTFIDTSGKDKETMIKYFPNLHNEISITPKKQKWIN